MKRIIALLTITTILVSCGGKEVEKTSLETLKSEKIVITNKIDSLNKELKTIEKEIAKLDTSKKLSIITTLPVKNNVFKHYIEIQGNVQADKSIEIRPELGGTVKAIFVEEGQKVRAGQTLVQLDDAQIRNSITELNTQLNLAKTTFERQERLWKQKIGSEMQYLQAKAQKEGLENSLSSLYTQSKKMKITAPFNGIVDEIFPKKGELTSPQTPVVRLINLSKVYIEADVTESYLPVVKKGSEVVISFPSLNKEITSNITQTGNYINPENRSFKTRIDLDNKDQSIKPNLLADIRIVDFEANGISIPSTLVQQDQNGSNYVFVVETTNDEHKIVKRMVTVANEYDHNAFISEGLKENDTLVNSGARLVKEGDIVKIAKNESNN